MEASNSIVHEYYELWNKVLAETDEYLPHVVGSALATTREKINVDTIDLVLAKQKEMYELRKKLKSLDESYNDMLTTLKQMQTIAAENHQPFSLERDERCSRIIDFMFGLITSLNRDFSGSPELAYFMQQVYLFAAKNSDL